MEQIIFRKRYANWHFARMEWFLDARSAEGYTLVRATHRKQIFQSGGVPCRHRLGYCASSSQSADYITYVSKQERAGWELVCQEEGWLYFRKPLSELDEQDPAQLVDGREPIAKAFSAVTKRLESWRRVELVLAAALLVIGYAVNFWILRVAVIPLALVLLNTYWIKFLQQSLQEEEV